jgi:tryptophan synthase alpha subunit
MLHEMLYEEAPQIEDVRVLYGMSGRTQNDDLQYSPEFVKLLEDKLLDIYEYGVPASDMAKMFPATGL